MSTLNNNNMNRVFLVTIAVSFTLHILLYWLFMADLASFFAQPEQVQTQPQIQVALLPEVQQEPEQPPPPKHLQDDLNKANTQDGTLEKAKKNTSASKTASSKVETSTDNSLPSIEEVIAAAKQGKKLSSDNKVNDESVLEKIDSASDSLQSLSDEALAQNRVDSPLSSQEEEKARWYNAVLKRITEQVNYVWVKPDNIDPNAWGIIRLDIDAQGYLRSAWVHLPSGDTQLDQSALRAIRSVIRYQIPHKPSLSRYYRHLEFRYSGNNG